MLILESKLKCDYQNGDIKIWRHLQHGESYKTATFQILSLCNVHDFAVTSDFFSMKLQKLEDFLIFLF